jgi:2-oxoglutarate dehydrogenase E1 component
VYYDLLKYRQENEIENVAIARLEQFYPFADDEIEEQLKDFTSIKDIVWCQEEPRNMGAWTFVAPRFMELLQDGQTLSYIGRQASASPAAGQKKIHQAEQDKLVEDAMIVK